MSQKTLSNQYPEHLLREHTEGLENLIKDPFETINVRLRNIEKK